MSSIRVSMLISLPKWNSSTCQAFTAPPRAGIRIPCATDGNIVGSCKADDYCTADVRWELWRITSYSKALFSFAPHITFANTAYISARPPCDHPCLTVPRSHVFPTAQTISVRDTRPNSFISMFCSMGNMRMYRNMCGNFRPIDEIFIWGGRRRYNSIWVSVSSSEGLSKTVNSQVLHCVWLE